MPTALGLLTNLDLERNQLLRAAVELVAAPDATPVPGQLCYTDGTVTAYPKWSLLIRDGDTTPAWRVLGAINKSHTVTGFWSFKPDFRIDGGVAASGDPPFGVDPLRAGKVPNLDADKVDSWHAIIPVPDGTAAPNGSCLPVYDQNGRLSVADPGNPYEVVNLRTLQAASQGISPRDPCQYATTANLVGTRSGNVLTETGPGVLTVDGLNPAAGERVLVKNQTLGADNGIYAVTNAGAVGASWILTRAADADTSTEIRVGTTTYIEKGTANLSTQWQCSAANVLNTDPNLWVKSFQQAAYLAGKGMVLAGLTFHFGTSSNYTVNGLWYNSSTAAVAQLAPPSSYKFLSSPSGGPPAWADVAWADITGKPILPTAPPAAGGTVGRYTRWAASNALVDANLLDSGTAAVGAGNSLVAATISLGNDTAPYASAWTNELRVKSTAGAGPLVSLFGVQDATNDPNANHRKAVTWTSVQVKTWLAYNSQEVGAVPKERQITINGTTGQIDVATQPTWNLEDDRAWTLSLDLATLDTRWVTRHTAQTLSGQKSWYSATSSASEDKIRMQMGLATEPTWTVKTGGTVSWGDGTNPVVATIDFFGDRLRFDGRPVLFAAAAVIRATSALSGQGTPATLLGLTANDDMQRVTAADLTAFVGAPSLAYHAVGYGDSGNRLTGDALNFYWDASNKRLGIGMNAPATTLDILGAFNLVNSTTNATYPGINLAVTDTSNLAADWTNRFLYGGRFVVSKTGSATFVTSGIVDGLRSYVTISGGSTSQVVGVRAVLQIGAVSAAPNAGSIVAFYSQPTAASGVTGAISKLVHFALSDIAQPWPQPVEHYGMQVPNLLSATGATRTAALRLDLTTTGIGERFNIYAPGNALNYLAGNLGLGSTAPTARLEFAVGTTALAPARFASASVIGSLLTVPLAGALESRGDHLAFTDTTPTRRLLSYVDELGATEGGIVFTQLDRVYASLTAGALTEDLGTDPFTVWARFLVPTAFRGPGVDSIVAIGASSNSAIILGAILQMDSAGTLRLVFYNTGVDTRALNFTGFRTAYGGQVVDVCFVREGAVVPKMYVNGSLLSGGTDVPGGSAPAWNFDIDSKYFLVGQCHTTFGSVTRIDRAALFNRALTTAEVLSLGGYGMDDSDMWGSTIPVYTSNFTAGVDGWIGADGANTVLTSNQTVNGTPGWLTMTRANSDGRAEFCRTMTGYRQTSRWRIAGDTFHSTAQPAFVGASQGGSVGTGPIAISFPSGATLPFTFDILSRNINVTSVQPRIEPNTAATTGPTVTMPNGTAYSIKNVKFSLLGCVVDLDLAVGCGTTVPDRSGRYHGTIAGTGWIHVISTCPTELPSGSGTVQRGLRRYAQTITAKDNDLVTITHGLGTTNLIVSVWNAAGETVQVAARRKVGSETTAIEIGFGLVASPVTPLSFLVLIVG